MQKLALLTVALLLMTTGVGLAIKALTIAPPTSTSASTAAPPEATLSVEDVQRQVDVKSLPVREVRDPF